MGQPQFNRKELIQKIVHNVTLEDKLFTIISLAELTDLEIYKYYLCQKKVCGKLPKKNIKEEIL